MNRIAGRSFVVLLVALLLVAGMAFFVTEFAMEAEEWVMFPGSPHIYTSGRIGAGIVTDTQGEPLMDMSGDRTYHASETVRKATLHWLGDRDGNISTPALEEYPIEMTGYDILNGVYTFGNAASVTELTISAQVQAVALEALGGYHGTVAVYNYKTGEIICAVTTPTFDPENVPEITEESAAYDGVYVNRFTQSTYVPGSIFKIVTVAAALELVPNIEQEVFTCYGSYEYGVDSVTCEWAHYDQDIKEALANSCNCAIAQIVDMIGADKLEQYVEQYKVTEAVSFDGITTAEGNFDLSEAEPVEASWAGIGQYTDEINPCRFMTFMGAVAAGGTGAQPYIVSQIKVGEEITYSAQIQEMDRVMSGTTAEILKEYLRNNVETVYGDYNFPGLTVCAKSGTGEVGEEKKPNATFAGFVADEKYPFAFIVAVEDAGYGSEICVPILSKVLSACCELVDGN